MTTYCLARNPNSTTFLCYHPAGHDPNIRHAWQPGNPYTLTWWGDADAEEVRG